MNFKRRHRKPFKGCCSMCACRDHDMGVRNKRALKPQELRASARAREQLRGDA